MVSWIATALALLLGDRLLDGVFVGGIVPALLAALVLGFVNMTIKPVLFILTLPVTIVTLGLFTFILNAMMLGIAAWVVPDFSIDSLWTGILLAVIVAVIHAIAVSVFGKPKKTRLADCGVADLIVCPW